MTLEQTMFPRSSTMCRVRAAATLAAVVLFLAPLAAQEAARPAAPAPREIPARVDERVELLSVVNRLAGANEYSQAPATAAYVKEVDAHFGPHRGHPMIQLARRLRAQRGISFDAVASYAIHLQGGPILAPKVPFDDPALELEKRWTPAAAKEYLAALQQFADDTRAFTFFEKHRDYYARAAERLASEVARRPYRAWLDGFFGARPGAEFCALVGLLNGGSNYGVKVRHPDGREELLPIIGVSRFDQDGLPVFGPGSSALVAHEFCHAFCNPLVDRFADQLLPAGARIFERRAPLLRRQAYSNPRTMLYESLVRASTHRFLVRHGNPFEANAQLREEVARGFFWTPELSKLLGEFEADRTRYPALADFMPRVVAFFDALAADLDARLAKLPRLVRITPDNGASDVDPQTAELVLEFDRPMNRGGYSFVGNPKDTPRARGKGVYSDDGKTFRLPVTLEPGKTYRFSLNSIFNSGFSSSDGLPLDPVEVTFTTRQ